MDILQNISQVCQKQLEFSGNPEESVFVFKGILGETLVRRPQLAGSAAKIIAAFSENPVQSDFYEVFEADKINNLIPRLAVKTAILCVPHKEVAYIAGVLFNCGIVRILNWSGSEIAAPEGRAVLNEEPPYIAMQNN